MTRGLGYTQRRRLVGTVHRLDTVTTTDWRIAHDVDVTITCAELLGCGCTRLTADRPGPADGPCAGQIHMHIDRCEFHQANPPDGETRRREAKA